MHQSLILIAFTLRDICEDSDVKKISTQKLSRGAMWTERGQSVDWPIDVTE